MNNNKLESVLRFNSEEFTTIKRFDKYAISKSGKILNKETMRLISPYVGTDLYEHCVLFMRGKRYRKRVHRLMGEVFLGNPQVINHINGNKSDNRLENLERSTHSKNIKHAYDNGYYLSKKSVNLVVKNRYTGEVIHCSSMREAQRVTGVERHRIKTFLSGSRNNYTDWEFAVE